MPAEVLVPALTVEVALYAALAVVALVMRLLVLGGAPLGADEAAQALTSFNFLNARPDPFTGSPLLFAGNALLFALFGANDGLARVLPALCGAALALLPALLRRELGRAGALIASVLLLLSPSLVFFSRSADGAIIAVTGALAALVFAWRYATAPLDSTGQTVTSARPLSSGAVAVVAGALALLAAPEAWMVIAGVGLFVLLRLSYLRELAREASGTDARTPWRRAGLLFAAVFIGIATVFLMHREGLGAAFNLFGEWLGGLVPGGPLFDPLRLLVIYEPVPLFFGAVGIVDVLFAWRAADRDEQPLGALAVWAMVAFALYSLGGNKNPAHLVVLVVPLALIAGWYIGAWLTRWVDEATGIPGAWQVVLTQEVPVFAFAVALAGFLYFVTAEFATRGTVMAADLIAGLTRSRGAVDPAFNLLVLAVLVLIAVGAVVFLAITTVGWARSRNIALALALVLLTFWTFRQMTLANFSGEWAAGATAERNPQEWLVVRATSTSVRDLADDLLDISRWRANDSHTLTILADDALGPVVKWYLRDFRNARFESHPVMIPGIQGLVVPANAPVNPGSLMSQRYLVQAARSSAAQPNFLRWLIFRDTGLTDYSEAVLWIPQPQ